VYGVCALLHIIVPATKTDGYVCDRSGRTLPYRLNGLRVLLIMDGAYIALIGAGVFPAGFIVSDYWSFVYAANVLGIVSTFALFARAADSPERQRRCLTRDNSTPRKASAAEIEEFGGFNFLVRLYTGLEFNPRLAFLGPAFDVKMWLYLVRGLSPLPNTASQHTLTVRPSGGLPPARTRSALSSSTSTSSTPPPSASKRTGGRSGPGACRAQRPAPREPWPCTPSCSAGSSAST
jgi:hypothetical protein